MIGQFLRLPPWIIGISIVSVFVLVALTELMIFRRFVKGRLHFTHDTNNDVIFFASAISIFYSLIVGLIAVGVWRTHTDAEQIVSEEATAIGCFYRDVSGYSEPTRGMLQQEVHDYVNFIIDVAWPLQRRRIPTTEATRRLTKLETDLVSYEPKTVGQQILHAQALSQYNEIAGLRRKRLNLIGTGLPAVMWNVVLLGAALVIGVTYLLQVHERAQYLLTGALAMFIGLVVFVIASLDRPLSGPLGIDSKPYRILRDGLIELK